MFPELWSFMAQPAGVLRTKFGFRKIKASTENWELSNCHELSSNMRVEQVKSEIWHAPPQVQSVLRGYLAKARHISTSLIQDLKGDP